MVRNLHKAGHDLVVFDKHPEKVEAVFTEGIRAGSSAANVAVRSEIIITMLPDGPQVEEAMFCVDGILGAIHPGSVIVDMSSVSPLVSQRVATACTEKGVAFLDAPVSGGEPKAIEGTLAVMAGGDKSTFDAMEPLLRAMASSVTLTGGVGAGNVTKLANQIMVACNIAGISEALVLADRCGVDASVVFEAVKGGLAGSNVLNAKAPMVIAKNFNPGFRIRLHQKDLRNALLTAESKKVALPLTSLVQQILIALMNRGEGDLDHSAIFKFIDDMAPPVKA
jgi:2-hydroxy-3-oxopropionate reductase